MEKLTHFCRKGWREVKPEPWHKTANNWVGQIFGLVHKVPGVLKGMYSQFSKDYSDTQILFMALSVPVVSRNVVDLGGGCDYGAKNSRLGLEGMSPNKN